MTIFKKLTVFFVLAWSAMLTGCASGTHDLAPELGPAQKASLKGRDPIRLLVIDGRSGPNRLGFGSDWNGDFDIQLAPGNHSLGLEFLCVPMDIFLADSLRDSLVQLTPGVPITYTPAPLLTSHERRFLEFEAKPGHQYRLVNSHNKTHWTAAIKESYMGVEQTAPLSSVDGSLDLKRF